MGDGNTQIINDGLTSGIWRKIQPRVALALERLDLEGIFGTVVVSADDLPGDGQAWYAQLPGSPVRPGPVLVLTCHVEVFCRLQVLRTTTYPPPAVWEKMDAPLAADPVSEDDFDEERTDFFLNHHLLTVADLRSGDLDSGAIPAHLAEALGVVWAVSVDGRLERMRCPGYPMAERRGQFSRLFSSAGILLPEHWQVFESLWDGAVAGQSAILAVTRLLPRLYSQSGRGSKS